METNCTLRGDLNGNVIPGVDVNVLNAANGVWVARLLAVALEPFKAHGISSPAVGLPWYWGRDNPLIKSTFVASLEAAWFCARVTFVLKPETRLTTPKGASLPP